jgi:biopolymer transport protein ExbD
MLARLPVACELIAMLNPKNAVPTLTWQRSALSRSVGTMKPTTRPVFEDKPVAEINTTPLVDIMLVLLVTLIITVPVMTHSTHLDVSTGPASPKPSLLIEIDYDGSITCGGQDCSTKAGLEKFFAELAAHTDRPQIIIAAHARSPYDATAHTLASAQRHGFNEIGFRGLAAMAPTT